MKKAFIILSALILLAGCQNAPATTGEGAAPAPTAAVEIKAWTAAPTEEAAVTAAPDPAGPKDPEWDEERILAHCISILDALPYPVDLDGDGETEIVDLAENEESRWSVQVTRGGDVKRFPTEVRTEMPCDLWIGDLDEDGGYEIFFHGDLASEDYVIYAWRWDLTPILFEPDDRCVRPGDEPDPTVLYSAVEGFEDGHLVTMASVDMLGTHWGIRTYAIGDDGIIGPVSTVWSFSDEDRPLTVKKALTAYAARVRKDPGEAFTLAPGTKIYVTASDGCSRMWFDTEKGQSGVLLLVPDEDPLVMWRIDGVPEAEFFEELPYSG